jgi:hypothetical protein
VVLQELRGRTGGLNAVLGLIALTILIITGWVSWITSFAIRDPESISHMSGRVPLCEEMIRLTFGESPWIGLGFHATRLQVMEIRPEFGTTHSAYVEILAGAGIAGLLAFLLILVPLARKAFLLYLRESHRPEVLANVALLGCCACLGVTDRSIVMGSPAGVTFWTMASLTPVLWRTAERKRRARAISSLRRT